MAGTGAEQLSSQCWPAHRAAIIAFSERTDANSHYCDLRQRISFIVPELVCQGLAFRVGDTAPTPFAAALQDFFPAV